MKIRSIIHTILVLTVVAGGFPVFHPEDADRNSEIDLKDAITHVRSVTHSAERPEKFGTSVKKAISTFHAVAELKVQIEPLKKTELSFSTDSFYISKENGSLAPFSKLGKPTQKPYGYSSVFYIPDPPIPKTV